MAKQYVELWNVTHADSGPLEIMETDDMGKALWKRIVALETAYWRCEGYRIKTVYRKSKSGKVSDYARKTIFRKREEVR